MRIAIYGAGKVFDEIMNCRIRDDVDITVIIDNDAHKWGSIKTIYKNEMSCEMRIDSMNHINPEAFDRVLITTFNYQEIEKNLIGIGIASERIWYACSNDSYNFDVLRKVLCEEDVKWLMDKNMTFIKFDRIDRQLEYIRSALGRIESRQSERKKSSFKVFSQWDEDGIIQWLINNISIRNKVFVEFGVENYTESNTRFLLTNNNWSGLVIDGNRNHIDYIKRDEIYWRYNLKADCGFITAENINDIIERNGLSGNIGLLSIDVDGNDYWIWESIRIIDPDIIVCEYNSIFGYKNKVTTPYREDFVREKYHYSGIVYGASIAALVELGKKKGYCLVAGNMFGNNVFFLKKELCNDIVCEIPISEAYVKAQFREMRNQNGELMFNDFEERAVLVGDAVVWDIQECCEKRFSELV